MGYLDELAGQAGPAQLRSVAVRLALASERGDFFGCLPPLPLEVGEGVADCAVRAAAQAGLGPVAPVACIAVASDPGRRVTGPGRLLRQEIEIVVWARPPDPLPTDGCGDRDPQVEAYLARFRSSRRPAFDGPSAVAPDVPGSYSGDAYWRRLRRRVGHAPLIMPAVAVLVFDDRGRVLLAQTRTWDRWMIPGGAVELGETIADTAVRKAREETGLVVAPEALLGAYAGPAFLTRYPNGDVAQHVSTPVLCRAAAAQPRAAVEEIQAVRPFEPAHLPPMFPQWESIVRDAFAQEFGRLR